MPSPRAFVQSPLHKPGSPAPRDEQCLLSSIHQAVHWISCCRSVVYNAGGNASDTVLLKITWKLDDSQWNNRLSLLTHRFLREYGIEREDEIVDKAWKTLELFCVGEEAIKSLQVRIEHSSILIQHVTMRAA
jgi:hypothetical protein